MERYGIFGYTGHGPTMKTFQESAIHAPNPESHTWAHGKPGAIHIGSDEHKRLFSRMLLDTFDPYRPAAIQWPKLDDGARARLVALPIWDIAVQTESLASVSVKTYAQCINDPLLKEAIELNAFEEARHKMVLYNLVEAYRIHMAPEPDYRRPRHPEWAFMVTGYSECVDSFFAFGLFEVARRCGYFPPELVTVFETVMQEEARHITFFVNWAAWHRRNLPLWKKPLFQMKVLGVWAFLVWERVGLVRSVGGAQLDTNFTLTGTGQIGVDVSARELLDICLSENERRLAGYGTHLLVPSFVPTLARLARRFVGKRGP